MAAWDKAPLASGKQPAWADAPLANAPAFKPTGPGAISAETDRAAVENAGGGMAALRGAGRALRDMGAGAIRGAGSIGATLLGGEKVSDIPFRVVNGRLVRGPGQTAQQRDTKRRAAMTSALGQMGADTNSAQFTIGKVGGEIAGTAGIGSGIAGAASNVPVLARNVPALIDAIGSGGMTAGGMVGAASLPARMAGGAISGGAQAGLVDPSQAGTGAVIGGVLPPALRGAGAVGGAAGRFLAQGVKKTPEAQRLLNAGVDLTPGMMNQTGRINSAEQVVAGTQIPFLSSAMEGARQGARESWQRSVIQQVAAPGARITSTAPQEMLDDAYKSFEPLYRQAKGVPAPANIRSSLETEFTAAANDLNIAADDAVRNTVRSWLGNRVTSLNTNKPITSTELLRLRSDIRAEARRYAKLSDGPSSEKVALFHAAEERISQVLRRVLPKQARQALVAADRQYGKYKIVESAMANAKDNAAGFSPEQLSQAVAQAQEKGKYARGAGGAVRRMARDAKATITGTAPRTGAMVPGIGAAGVALAAKPYVVGPAMAAQFLMSSTRTGRKFAGGQLGIQRRMNMLAAPAGRAGSVTQNALSRTAVPAYLNRPGQ